MGDFEGHISGEVVLGDRSQAPSVLPNTKNINKAFGNGSRHKNIS